MIDSYGRKINYLRISVTELCNLRCKYCMPEKGIDKCSHNDILRIEEFLKIAKSFVSMGIDKIRITGGEPLVRKGVLTLIKGISQIEGVNDLAMTTNGIFLKEYAKDLKEVGLNRVNVSLDTLNASKYKHITNGGNISKVLEGIEEAKKVGLTPIKLNVVLIKDFNEDEIEDFINLTKDYEIDVRFIELMPIGALKYWALNRYLSSDVVLEKNKELIKIENADKSSPAKYYKLPNGKGRVGIINPISCKFCDNCNRLRLTADGKIKTCLHSDDETDIGKVLRSGENIDNTIVEIVNSKPKEHNLEQGDYINRTMTTIGG
ncbi:GTP 3',8-cyclase MoaA [Clostridium uliginosum]|uniref:GTP 3',8-cyclase n=1 Tax=Clostridium uliginosum TaxID=119641 RepID=A0A1I1IT27_9CLOT|nr:GTP 3',8-cyclase MoaA [Clostridium uliginosum]SFC39376.1 cyclic pyranopterin phosphate synthase [Clostridium uliginosum]